MIITKDFTFLHFPKSGGSFTKSILSHLYETVLQNEYEQKGFFKKLFHSPPLYKKHEENLLINPLFPEYNFHNGFIDIPKEHIEKKNLQY